MARIWSTESVRHMWRPDSVLLEENLVATYGTQSVRLLTEYCHIWLQSGLIWTDCCQCMVSVGTRLSPNRPIVPICQWPPRCLDLSPLPQFLLSVLPPPSLVISGAMCSGPKEELLSRDNWLASTKGNFLPGQWRRTGTSVPRCVPSQWPSCYLTGTVGPS